MAKAGELRFVITTDSKGAVKSINAVTGAADKMQDELSRGSRVLGKFKDAGKKTLALIGGAAVAATGFLAATVPAAIDAIETTNKFQQVFKTALDEAGAASEDLVKNYGFATTESEKLLASTGDLLAGFGATDKQALGLSHQVQKLAADLTSFQNIQGGVTEASERLTRGILGEHENFKALGIAMLDTDVKLRLVQKGQQNLTGTALQLAKAQARIEIAMEQSGKSIGDWGKTANESANLLRVIGNRFQDLKVDIGKTLVESDEFNETLIIMKETLESESFKKAIADIINLLAKFVTRILQGVSAVKEFIEVNERIAETQKTQEEQLKKIEDKFWSFAQTLDLGKESTKKLLDELEGIPRITSRIDLGFGREKYVQDMTKAVDRTAEFNRILRDVQLGKFGKEAKDALGKINKGIRENIAESEKQKKAVAKVTATTAKQAKELTELDKIARKYNVSAQSANLILQAQRPELKEVEKLTKKLGISTEEATRLVRVMNQIEKERKGALKESGKEVNKWIKDVREWQAGNKELSDSLKLVLDDMGEFKDTGIEAGGSLDNFDKNANNAAENLKKLEKITNSTADEVDILAFAFDQLGKIGLGVFSDLGSAVLGFSKGLGMLKESFVFGADNKFLGLDFDKLLAGMSSFIGAAISGFKALIDLADDLTSTYGTLEERVEENAEETQRALNAFVPGLQLSEKAMEDLNIQILAYTDNGRSAEAATRDFIRTNTEALDKLLGSSEAQGALNNFLKEGAKDQEEFTRQINTTLAVFTGLMRSGASITDVLGKMDESFAILEESQKASGFATTGAFKELQKYRNLIKDNQVLVDSVTGFNATMELLGKTTQIDAKMFSDFSGQTLAQFDKLIAAGFNQGQALQLIAPSLITLRDLAKQYNFELDDGTKALIEQADASKLLDPVSPFQPMIDVLERIEALLRGDIPAAVDAMVDKSGESLKKFSRDIEKNFSGISETIGGLGVPGISVTPIQPVNNTGKLPGFATGGSFTVSGRGGTDSQLVAFRATPGERVTIENNRTNTRGGDTIVKIENITFMPGAAETPDKAMDNFIRGFKANRQNVREVIKQGVN